MHHGAQRIGVERELVGWQRSSHREDGDAHAQRENQKGQQIDKAQPVAQAPPNKPGQHQMQGTAPDGDLIGRFEHRVVVLRHGQWEQCGHQYHRAYVQLCKTRVVLAHVEDVDPQQ
ncbi:hypothetical protein SDC9_184877 [bioreactor metagenome]|uniref:Uncharacterized protein n=1 Tax=bioreactor metagenome TaxID=1076179 RepID=A0A645HF40_9ZZZZ